jgi:LmbE family N-acetylglucosaminyl deacetylase
VNTLVCDPPRASRLAPVEGLLELARTDRLLVVAPHPDDESLAAAGLLQQARRAGAALRVVYVTDGENNPWAQLVHEGRWPVSAEDRRRWGARRRREALHAIGQLGIEPDTVEFLGFPDQGLTDELARGDERLLRALAAELRATRPTVVAIPALADRHPDHSAIAVLGRVALRRATRPAPSPRVIQYLVHSPAWRESPSSWVRLDAAELEMKRRAILCHRTQLRWRRASLLAAARDAEDFVAISAARRHDPAHPIARAWFEGRDLVFDLARPPRRALGPTVLRVLIETRREALLAVALPLTSRRGPLAPLRSAGGGTRGEAGLDYDPAHQRWRLGLTALPDPRQVYLKLERPFERRLGFFDEAGWRPVPVRGQDPAGSQDEV